MWQRDFIRSFDTDTNAFTFQNCVDISLTVSTHFKNRISIKMNSRMVESYRFSVFGVQFFTYRRHRIWMEWFASRHFALLGWLIGWPKLTWIGISVAHNQQHGTVLLLWYRSLSIRGHIDKHNSKSNIYARLNREPTNCVRIHYEWKTYVGKVFGVFFFGFIEFSCFHCARMWHV